MKIFSDISSWFIDLFRVWRREFYLVFHDMGVILFFFALPLLYPVIYTLIYNPEVVTDIPVVIVDHSRTAESRKLARMIDATEAMKIYDYAPDMATARRYMMEHKCYGILEIPSGYARQLGQGSQAQSVFYYEMNLLLRYRTITAALADIQIELGQQIRTATADRIGILAQSASSTPVNSEAVMLGDPTQGFASFIMPGIVILILQQSIVLGVCMLMGGRKERERANGGVDPMQLQGVGTITMMLGKMLCVLTLYLPMAYYALHLLMRTFALPHLGDTSQYAAFIIPFLICCYFFARCVGQFVKDRETSMLVVVFSSVVFLFLSGLTWPRFAMPEFWKMVGDFVPATWGVQGFININNNAGTLHSESHYYTMLWVFAGVYFALSYLFARLGSGRRRSAVRA